MIFKPPRNIATRDRDKRSIFLAGSIEQGKAENWQERLEKLHENKYNVFNPRRDDWDSSWEQNIESPQFNQQVKWELTALDQSDIIVFYFSPGTQSPISLLELGLYANSNKKMYVICPEGFWRKGNVDIICEKYDIQLLNSLDEYMELFQQKGKIGFNND